MFPFSSPSFFKIPHQDFNVLFPVTLKFGHWYIAVRCPNCETLTALFADAGNGQSELNGSYFMRCPRCKQVGDFDAQHYQHRERRKPGIRIQIL